MPGAMSKHSRRSRLVVTVSPPAAFFLRHEAIAAGHLPRPTPPLASMASLLLSQNRAFLPVSLGPLSRSPNPSIGTNIALSHHFPWRSSPSPKAKSSLSPVHPWRFPWNQVHREVPGPRRAASGSLIPESEPQKPSFLEFVTSERVKVVSMLGLALALCNADWVVMSVAIVPLSQAHGWSQSFAGIVQSSFLWGYLMSPIIGGALVDYYGGKIVMAWGVTLWSMATFLTPWAAETSLRAPLAMRVLLGVAEGVALPSMNNMVLRWFPQTERSGAVGIAMGGFQLGNAIGLLIAPIIMSQAGVFGPFVIFGLFGFLWVLVWLFATSSAPDRHPQI